MAMTVPDYIKGAADEIRVVMKADPPGFEPESEAPEASMLSKLYYES